jgi:hypothetical protein
MSAAPLSVRSARRIAAETLDVDQADLEPQHLERPWGYAFFQRNSGPVIVDAHDRTVHVHGTIPTPKEILKAYEQRYAAKRPTIVERIASWFR